MIYYIPTNIPSWWGEYDLIFSVIGILIAMVGQGISFGHILVRILELKFVDTEVIILVLYSLLLV